MEKVSHQKDPCQFTTRAVAVATCAQHLTARGYSIVGIILNERTSIIFIEFSANNKNLKPVAAGSRWYKGALHGVFQANVKDVLVKWLEPSLLQPRKAVH
jgi:hypothetical protein